jgi:hypothetical protein
MDVQFKEVKDDIKEVNTRMDVQFKEVNTRFDMINNRLANQATRRQNSMIEIKPRSEIQPLERYVPSASQESSSGARIFLPAASSSAFPACQDIAPQLFSPRQLHL